MASTAWAFGPLGVYTATWDGVGTVTVTLTSNSAFLAAFSPVANLSAAQAAVAEWGGPPAGAQLLVPVEVTPAAGFALTGGTPTVISWQAPADGNQHFVAIGGDVHVTSTETGGVIDAVVTDPAGNNVNSQIDAGGHGAGTFALTSRVFTVQGGSTVSVAQGTALTVGAAAVFAAILGA